MKKCCFTGHRNVDLSENLINITTNIIIRLIEEKGVTEYYGGGAIGWDMLCERIILMLKQKYPFIHLHLFLPCPPENQTEFWIKEDKDLYYKILAVADSVKVISPKYYKGCMKKRNEELVNEAEYCVCYYNEKRKVNGTGQTVRIAERKGIEIINLFKC